jgi:hypothetical protein
MITSERIKSRPIWRRRETNQVCRALAIRCAKARYDDAGLWKPHRRARPIAFSARHAVHCPYLDDASAPGVEQIIHVPVETLFGAQMTRQSPRQAAGAERAAHVEIKTGRESKPSQLANGDFTRAVERNEQRISAESWLHVGMITHSQLFRSAWIILRSVTAKAKLPSSSSATQRQSATWSARGLPWTRRHSKACSVMRK